MQTYKTDFIQFALQHHVLRFGEFTLKSGRVSPYFFNAGLFNSGASLQRLGQFYAQAITAANVSFDMLFGPAYKGIPLATATSIALAAQRDVPVCFNRKEAKRHGEGGMIVGAAISGRVLIIDDVITAGTAIREAKTIIEQNNGKIAGITIALNREERGVGERSTIDEIQTDWGVPVVSIISLSDLVAYLQQSSQHAAPLAAIQKYQQEYGV